MLVAVTVGVVWCVCVFVAYCGCLCYDCLYLVWCGVLIVVYNCGCGLGGCGWYYVLVYILCMCWLLYLCAGLFSVVICWFGCVVGG